MIMTMSNTIRMMILAPHVDALLMEQTQTASIGDALQQEARKMFAANGVDYKFKEGAQIAAAAHDPIRRQALVANMGELLKEAATRVLEASGLAPETAGKVKAPAPAQPQLVA